MVALFSAVSLLAGTLHGQVMRGPTMPVCQIDRPCAAPATHIRLFFSRSSRTTTATTDAKGRYRVSLAAGTYAVRTDQRPFGTVPQPAVVRVRANSTRRVDFHIDTGIR
jgi:hypothetical protein